MGRGASEEPSEERPIPQQRREKDEQRLTDLRGAIDVVEASLESEVAKRVEMGKALHAVRALARWATPQFTDSQLRTLESRVKEEIERRNEDTRTRIGELHTRIDALEVKFAEDKAEVLAEVERRNAELAVKLEEFHNMLEAEKADRIARETRLAEDISAVESSAAAAFELERGLRERAYMELKVKLDEAVRSRTKADERFQARMQEEMGLVRNLIRKEEEAREKEDDEILETLNRYAQKLQASLYIINSSDVELIRAQNAHRK